MNDDNTLTDDVDETYWFRTELRITFEADGWKDAQSKIDRWKEGIEHADCPEDVYFKSMENVGPTSADGGKRHSENDEIDS